jgi:hypothetical protein
MDTGGYGAPGSQPAGQFGQPAGQFGGGVAGPQFGQNFTGGPGGAPRADFMSGASGGPSSGFTPPTGPRGAYGWPLPPQRPGALGTAAGPNAGQPGAVAPGDAAQAQSQQANFAYYNSLPPDQQAALRAQYAQRDPAGQQQWLDMTGQRDPNGGTANRMEAPPMNTQLPGQLGGWGQQHRRPMSYAGWQAPPMMSPSPAPLGQAWNG